MWGHAAAGWWTSNPDSKGWHGTGWRGRNQEWGSWGEPGGSMDWGDTWAGAGAGASTMQTLASKDTTEQVWSKASTLGGPPKGGHALPIELRTGLIRSIIQEWNSARLEPDPKLKINAVCMLQWTAETVDGVIYYLSNAQRTTGLKLLGGSSEEVTAALTDSFKTKYPTDEARVAAVEWLMQNTCNGIIHGPASSGGRGMGAHMQAAACHDPDFRNCDSEYKKIH